MIIPTIIPIQPDEHICGYLERLADANNIPVNYFLQRYFGIKDAAYTPEGHLHQIFGLKKIEEGMPEQFPDLYHLLSCHTTAMIDTIFMDLFSGATYIEALINTSVLTHKIGVRAIRYCPYCAANDKKEHAIPIIHAPHQSLAVSACWKHGVYLTEDPDDQGVLANDEEIKTAVFMHELYSSGIVGTIADVREVLIDISIKSEVANLVRTGDIRHILNHAGFSSIGALYQQVFRVKGVISKVPNIAKGVSQFVPPERLIAEINSKDIEKIEETCRMTAAASGVEVVDFSYPFVIVKCTRCAYEHTMYVNTMLVGFPCPACIRDKNEAQHSMVNTILTRDSFTSTNTFVSYRHEYVHKCGERVLSSPRAILASGRIICRKCSDKTGLNRRSKVVEMYMQRIGEKYKMQSGQEAEIIDYRGVNEVDIMFSDGHVLTNVSYSALQRGLVGEPAYYKYIGKKKKMNCGLTAEIIAYRSYVDIDVRFENGIVLENVNYVCFKNGSLQIPARYRRIGMSKVMKCGLKAEISEYRNSKDITVIFENGEKIEGVSCYMFDRLLLYPDSMRLQSTRKGEQLKMNCGLIAEIIAYRSCSDIDVRFENGVIREHVSYKAFKLGALTPKNIHRKKRKLKIEPEQNKKVDCSLASDRIGEKRRMKCGQEAVIENYRNYSSIDILFDDGSKRTTSYGRFKAGTVMPISIKSYNKTRVGEKRVMNNGMMAEIIAYRNCRDIDIRFENGIVRKGVLYDSFKKGTLSLDPDHSLKVVRTGEKRMMKCGQEAVIVNYRNCSSIDILFDDGSKRTTSYGQFKSGGVSPIGIKSYYKIRVGEKRMMNNGMMAEIIAYRNSRDIDVRFDDGSVIRSVEYRMFIKGTLVPPEKTE